MKYKQVKIITAFIVLLGTMVGNVLVAGNGISSGSGAPKPIVEHCELGWDQRSDTMRFQGYPKTFSAQLTEDAVVARRVNVGRGIPFMHVETTYELHNGKTHKHSDMFFDKKPISMTAENGWGNLRAYQYRFNTYAGPRDILPVALAVPVPVALAAPAAPTAVLAELVGIQLPGAVSSIK